ncbi:MAG: hypothetical protein KBT28_07175 [Bacteroidales bacterium]|nr:hypothetical protein [Candidatus Colimorpha merdihippi]
MRITEEQKSVLDSLVVERLRDHRSENATLVNSFSNKKNPVLERIIRTKVSFDRDSEGTVAYYVVKAPTGELLLYFSLKCGELFEKLDQFKLDLAYRVKDAVNVLQHKEQYSNDVYNRAEVFINQNITEIKQILPDIDKYLEKKEGLSADLRKELNTEMQRVLKTYPAIELQEFCANDNGRKIWKELGIKRKLGECVFWHKIVDMLDSVQKIAGCQYVYLFAADASADGELVNYYKERLMFEQSAVLGANKPKYDFQCYFLCQSIIELNAKRNQFYEDFNIDSDSIV